MLKVGDDVTPRDPNEEGSYEEIKISNFSGRHYCVCEENSYCHQRVWPTDIKHTYFANIWFSSVKTAEEMAAAGVNYCGEVKTIHKGFCLATLEKFMKDWPGGSYLVLKSTPRFTGETALLAIGYKYNSMKVLGLIATEGDGSTEPGDPYLSRFPDIYSNVSVCPIFCPRLLGGYFNYCNAI